MSEPCTSLAPLDLMFDIAADIVLSHPAFGPETCTSVAECMDHRDMVEHLKFEVELSTKYRDITDWGCGINGITELVGQFTCEVVFWERNGTFGWNPFTGFANATTRSREDAEYDW